MYCPRCGREQTPGELRFCSQCGFPLDGVTELVATGGSLPLVPGPKTSTLSPRQKGMRQGAMIMASTLVVIPFVIFVLVAMLDMPGELLPLVASILFCGGLLRILYAALFEDSTPGAARASKGGGQVLFSGQANSVVGLPPQRSIPASPWSKRVDTGELRYPSITENTTRHLDAEKALGKTGNGPVVIENSFKTPDEEKGER